MVVLADIAIGLISLWQADVSKHYRVAPLAQVLLEKHDIPYVGLQYVVEVQPAGKPDLDTCYYVCALCSKKMSSKTLIAHVRSVPHRLKFTEHHCPKLHATYGSIQIKQWTAGLVKEFSAEMVKVAETIGKFQMAVCEERFMNPLLATIKENIGNVEKFRKFMDIGSAASSTSGSKTASRSPMVRPSGLPDFLREKLQKGLKSFPQDDNYIVTQGRRDRSAALVDMDSPSPKRAKHNTGGAPYSEGRSCSPRTRLTSSSPVRSNRLLSSDRASQVSAFKKDFDNFYSRHAEKEMYYKKNPESHPEYSSEWKLFWERRYHELASKGINPNKHDFKSEWAIFWSDRMKDIFGSIVEHKKESLMKKHQIAKEDLEERRPVSPWEESEAQTSKPSTKIDFSVVGTLNGLIEVENLLGAFGPAVKTLLYKALNFSAEGKKSIDIFFDPDNLTLMKLSQDKLAMFSNQHESRSMYDSRQRAIVCCSWLLSEVEKQRSAKDDYLGLDIKDISAKTMGMDTVQIAQQIALSLLKVGKSNVSEDDLQKILLAVSAAHAKLMIDNKKTLDSNSESELQVSSTTPTVDGTEFSNFGKPLFPSAVATRSLHVTEAQTVMKAPAQTSSYVSSDKPDSPVSSEKSRSIQANIEPPRDGRVASGALGQLISAYDDEPARDMEKLSLEDLVNLLSNFRDLSREEQSALTTYLKRLEATDTKKVTRLREMVQKNMKANDKDKLKDTAQTGHPSSVRHENASNEHLSYADSSRGSSSQFRLGSEITDKEKISNYDSDYRSEENFCGNSSMHRNFASLQGDALALRADFSVGHDKSTNIGYQTVSHDFPPSQSDNSSSCGGFSAPRDHPSTQDEASQKLRDGPPTPRDALPTPRVGPPTPRDGPPAPRDGPPAPRDGAPTLRDGAPARRDGPPTPRDGPPTPRDGPPTPRNTSEQHRGSPKAGNSTPTKREGISTPCEEPLIQQHIEAPTPSEGPSTPRDDPTCDGPPTSRNDTPTSNDNTPNLRDGPPSAHAEASPRDRSPTSREDTPSSHDSQPVSRQIMQAYDDGPPMMRAKFSVLRDGSASDRESPPLPRDGLSMHGDGPSMHGDCLPVHRDGPPVHRDGPPVHRDGPPVHRDGPPVHRDGPPVHRDGPPVHRDGPPVHRDGPPMHGDGPPMHRDCPPMHRDGPPMHHDGPPMPRDGPPMPRDGLPMHRDGPPMHREGPPMHREGPLMPRDGLSMHRDGPPMLRDGPPEPLDDPPMHRVGLPVLHDGPPLDRNSRPMHRDGPPMYRDGRSFDRDNLPVRRDSPPLHRGDPLLQRDGPPILDDERLMQRDGLPMYRDIVGPRDGLPIPRDRPPRYNEGLLLHHDNPPVQRDRPPLYRDRSPVPRGNSPLQSHVPSMRRLREEPPMYRDRPPIPRERSPIYRDESPVYRNDPPMHGSDHHMYRDGFPRPDISPTVPRDSLPLPREGSPFSRYDSNLRQGEPSMMRDPGPAISRDGPPMSRYSPPMYRNDPRSLHDRLASTVDRDTQMQRDFRMLDDRYPPRFDRPASPDRHRMYHDPSRLDFDRFNPRNVSMPTSRSPVNSERIPAEWERPNFHEPFGSISEGRGRAPPRGPERQGRPDYDYLSRGAPRRGQYFGHDRPPY